MTDEGGVWVAADRSQTPAPVAVVCRQCPYRRGQVGHFPEDNEAAFQRPSRPACRWPAT